MISRNGPLGILEQKTYLLQKLPTGEHELYVKADGFQEFKKKGEVTGAEFNLIKKDNSIITISLDGKISYDEKGNFKPQSWTYPDYASQQYRSIFREIRDNYLLNLKLIHGKKSK